ncbi:MAG: hypothetical protein DWQ35_12205 [Planctomycetota bacterium]|nr:MAG: hypothetical protein DWQ35_12205 [Planctomycetota bacterium]REK18131.1 MAG: hypothetical protein DWQ42_20860 [Planctomycetota bacterium]REK44206.1 MAG: hypothetical protein DWQ46_10485 [Planctomycetota bacterium]
MPRASVPSLLVLATALISVGGTAWQVVCSQEPPNTTISAESYGLPPLPASALGPRGAADPPPGRPYFVGSASCATSNCHGGPTGEGRKQGSEYSWWAQDPHSRAYYTLLGKDSQAIVARLRWSQPAHLAEGCLVCHATGDDQAIRAIPHRLAEGVGCESCHGAASEWLDLHVGGAWWAASQAEKQRTGFINTDDLRVRAKMCSDCHVGSSDRAVNHDLYAAGHPPLAFEMSAYHTLLPKHWRRDEDKRRHGETFEAQLWLRGQFAAADAALGRLEQFATDQDAAWPELAEYNCYSCHHELAEPSWRRDPAHGVGRPGSLVWEAPYAELLAAVIPGEEDHALRRELGLLRAAMHESLPRRETVRAAVQRVRRHLARLANEVGDHEASPAALSEQLRRLVQVDSPDATARWSDSTQRYLGVVALRQAVIDVAAAQPELRPPWLEPVGRELVQLRQRLVFPQGYLSPRGRSAQQLEALATSLAAIGELLEAR